MTSSLKQGIAGFLGGRISALGFAPVERFNEAPEAHHPSLLCKDASTVVVFGITIPEGVLRSPGYNLHMLHRTYHSVYPLLDEIALGLANYIETQAGALAVPVPSYAPLVYHGVEPWGLLSLKHAASKAGLGAFGKNGLLHHPAFGTLLRLGAVVTNADIPGDPLLQDNPCPENCTACQQVCPAGAFDQSGAFHKLKCLRHTIKHAISPLALKGPDALKHIERVINTAGYNYWLKCDECLKVCPSNRR